MDSQGREAGPGRGRKGGKETSGGRRRTEAGLEEDEGRREGGTRGGGCERQ